MSRRLKKLIEEKAWETLTDYGHNDSQLLEQLAQKVLSRLNEEDLFRGDPGRPFYGDPNSVEKRMKTARQWNELVSMGLVLYLPISGSTGGVPHLYAAVLPITAGNDFHFLRYDFFRWRHANPDKPISEYQPDIGSMSEIDFRSLFGQTNIEYTSQRVPQNPDGSYDYALAGLLLQRKIASLGLAFSIEGLPGLYDDEPVSFDDGPMGANRLLRKIIKNLRKKYPGIDPNFGRPDGTPVGDPDVEYEPETLPFNIDIFRRTKVPGGPGAGMPGGGRMAPPSQPPQQRMPRMPGQGFGGGQGMPTPGFAPPTPPMQ